MSDEYENLKNKHLIAYLFKLDDKTGDINFSNEIKLRKITSKEKEIFFKHYDGSMVESALTHCMEFTVSDHVIESMERSVDKKILNRYSVDDWSSISIKDREMIIIESMAGTLDRLIQAINISVSSPCQILRVDIYNEENDLEKVGRPHPTKYLHGFDCLIENEDVKIINNIFSKIIDADRGLYEKNFKKDWWIIAVEYFHKYSDSEHSADQAIDLTIALESLLSGPDENMEIGYRIRFRSSLYLYHLHDFDPKQIQDIVKAVYNVRSKIVHGSSTLGNVEFKDVKVAKTQMALFYLLDIFCEIFRLMLCDAILNHSDKSKAEFISYVDIIWQIKDDSQLQKWDLENYEY